MLFPSVIFLLYFLPAALLLYWTFEFSRTAQNICLLVFSLAFYAWGEPLHLVPMLLLVVVNHFAGRHLAAQTYVQYKRRIVFWTVLLNVGILLLTLHGEALTVALSEAMGTRIPWSAHTPPLGVPFFTLQALSYVFDIGRGKARPEKSILNTALYISFLPTVLAGPILRFGDMAPQLRERRTTLTQFGLGCERFIVGLAKVILLGIPLDGMSSAVFNLSAAGNEIADTPVLLAWLGLFTYGLRFYIVFSGYADMAIGLGRMFGFTVPENFRYPYAARTVAEFWKRCHITMYRWFFVYVFMSMGGSRPKKVRVRGAVRLRNHVLRNLVVLWLLIGLWHGVSWNHLILGVWFFVFAFLEWIVSLQRKNTTHFAWHIYLVFVVCVAWVLLRCNNFGETLNFFANMLGVNGNGVHSELAWVFLKENWYVFLLSVVFCMPLGEVVLGWLRRDRPGAKGYCTAALYLAVIFGLLGLSFVFLARTGSAVPLVFG